MTGRERLAFLAQKLRENAANPTGTKFDLSDWLYNPSGKFTRDCGTTACAFGFAALLPEFQAEGLHMCPTHSDSLNAWVDFEGHRNFEAAEAFFDLPLENEDGDRISSFLFDPTWYTNTKGAKGELAVVEKIEAYLAGKDISGNHW